MDLKLNVFYDNALRLFRNSRNLVFEFDKNIKEVVGKNNTTLFVHLFANGEEKFANADKNINDFVQIGNKFYYPIDLKGKKFENLEKINFGFYDSKIKKNSAKFSINLKEQK